MVDDIWEARLQSGDPLENLLHKTEVGAVEVHMIVRKQQKKQRGEWVVIEQHRERGLSQSTHLLGNQLHTAGVGTFAVQHLVQGKGWGFCC